MDCWAEGANKTWLRLLLYCTERIGYGCVESVIKHQQEKLESVLLEETQPPTHEDSPEDSPEVSLDVSSEDSSEDLSESSGTFAEAELPWMAWQDELPKNHPRYRIRHFLHRLFRFLGSELPAEWPDVSPTVHCESMTFLQDHLEQLYHYVEHQNEFDLDQQLMPRYLGETALYLMRVDYIYPVEMHTASEEAFQVLADRPQAIIEFDQLYCSPDSTERRANRIRERFDYPGSRVLMLGDDDLVSVLLSQNFQGEVHMIDLDDRLLEYIGSKCPNVHLHKADFLYKGIPPELYQTFDAVMLDPPWTFYHMWCFLDKAMYCLKDDPQARLFLSYCPLLLEHRQKMMAQFQRRVALRGFTFDSIETAFNLYDLSPEDLPDFQSRLDKFLPPIESPLLEFLRQLPYAHAQLYVLRRIPHYRPNVFRRWFFKWWNTE